MYNPLTPSEKGPNRSERTDAAQVLYVELMEGFRSLDQAVGPSVAKLDEAEAQAARAAQEEQTAPAKNPLFDESVSRADQAETPPAGELTVDSAREALRQIWEEAA